MRKPLINKNRDAANFIKKTVGTMITVMSGSKLVIGQVEKDHVFESTTKTVGGNTYTETKKAEEGNFIYNNIVFDGENRDFKSSGATALSIRGKVEINGGEFKNFKNIKENAFASPLQLAGNSPTDRAQLIINDISLHNNEIIDQFHGVSGIYLSNNAELVMNGGRVYDNKSDFTTVGVSHYARTDNTREKPQSNIFILNDGVIENNKVSGGGMTQYTAGGGGVTVFQDGTFIMNGGKIRSNMSYHGGGVFVSNQLIHSYSGNYTNTRTDPYDRYNKAEFIMNGGEISGNHAVADGVYSGTGGGLFVDSNRVEINAGSFLNNHADNMGGGIYVSCVPISFKLKNALITENLAYRSNVQYHYAGGNGGGFWNCPTGTFDFGCEDGNIIWNNTAEGRGNDTYASGKTGRFLLNGQDISNCFINKFSLTDRCGRKIDYITENGSTSLLCDSETAFRLKFDDKTLEEVVGVLPVIIKGNKAQKGGGVGSNANISFGESESHRISVKKIWDKDISHKPEEIEVILVLLDEGGNEICRYGKIDLNAGNGWAGEFVDLPYSPEEMAKMGYHYSVKEAYDSYYSVVEEVRNKLEIKRLWLPSDHSVAPWDAHNPFYNYFVEVIYQDEEGKTVDSDRFRLKDEFKYDWTHYIHNSMLEGLKPEDLNISYYGFNEPYKWAGFYGLDNYASREENAQKIYISKNKDGSVHVKLPYLWIQGYAPVRTEDYTKNEIGLRVNLKQGFGFNLINYNYLDLPVEKVWDSSIDPKDIPNEITLELYVDGERYIDEKGKGRKVTLTKANGWKGVFKDLPSAKILSPARYTVREDTDGFISLQEMGKTSILDLDVERISSRQVNPAYKEDYPIQKDYTGGISRIHSIPVRLTVDDKEGHREYTTEIKGEAKKPGGLLIDGLFAHFKDILIDENIAAEDITIEYYYNEKGDPFFRNLGKFQSYENGEFVEVNNPGEYILKLERNGEGKYILYVPKLTTSEHDYNLLRTLALKVRTDNPKMVVTNFYEPKHALEIKKKWEIKNSSSIPHALIVTVKDDSCEKKIILSEENNWTYKGEDVAGFLKKHNYIISEEDISGFTGFLNVFQTLVLETKEGKTVSLVTKDGKQVDAQFLDKLLKEGKIDFQIIRSDNDAVRLLDNGDGTYTVVYPSQIRVKEILMAEFINRENLTEEPGEPWEPENPKKLEEPEKPKNPETPSEPEPSSVTPSVLNTPKTGDVGQGAWWIIMMLLAGSILIISGGKQRKSES